MDISHLFKGQNLELSCPKCSEKITFDASKAFKSNSSISCSRCGTTIKLDNQDAIRDVEKQLGRLKDLFS
ncbi:hypothetical protein [Anoxybacillus ayderensis]|uniref:hypothetical protein n=1 Tax=Anoxybacillus ayderensis TaxID=265546 RepID=UPI0005ACE051|nr:hypothetical protein [Anoxybacillus ayderensis]